MFMASLQKLQKADNAPDKEEIKAENENSQETAVDVKRKKVPAGAPIVNIGESIDDITIEEEENTV